ncbi:hypothetical protein CspHIS471_0511060 [Cutaneotrichosporon sp. HIS471]|nr:hypothetical protein CspHIS471_0511060 [Cutaneotrichosporon sp. HIS471]
MASNGIARPPPALQAVNRHVSMDTPYTNGYSPPPLKPLPAPSIRDHAPFTWHRDMREYLPPIVRRFFGYREPGTKAPYQPLPFPPFTWFARLPLKYEVWLMSFIGSFVGIALIEIVMIAGFHDEGVIMIVASFGASAVLTFATIDSPLAQPRHLVGGQVVSAIASVAITRCFRHATGYHLEETTSHDGLKHVVWINGALAMAAALLAMQVTGTTHPPGGATALIASVMPSGVAMSWRLVYIVIISGLLMLGWAMIINDTSRMAALEGRNDGFAQMDRVLSGKSNAPTRSWSRQTNDTRMAALEGRNDGFAQMDRVMTQLSSGTTAGSPPRDRDRDRRSWSPTATRDTSSVIRDDGF